MKKIKHMIKSSIQSVKGSAEQVTVCNFTDNYYGDQVCVIKTGHPQIPLK